MKIFIATDHRGINVEEKIIDYLNTKKIEVIKSNIFHNDNDDYVDFAFDIANKVKENPNSYGILICGTGIGMSIAANKVKGIRAARCVTTEDAYLTRTDNNSNILCMSYKLDIKEIIAMIDTFISTPFSNEERHIRRVNKIINCEDDNNES